MVRKYAKGKDDFGGNPFDNSPTGQKGTPLNKGPLNRKLLISLSNLYKLSSFPLLYFD